MKKIVLIVTTSLFIAAGGLFLSGCGGNSSSGSKQTEQHEHSKAAMDSHKYQLYTCPMHPEVTGKKGDECPKCGMKLTEPVKEKDK